MRLCELFICLVVDTLREKSELIVELINQADILAKKLLCTLDIPLGKQDSKIIKPINRTYIQSDIYTIGFRCFKDGIFIVILFYKIMG